MNAQIISLRLTAQNEALKWWRILGIMIEAGYAVEPRLLGNAQYNFYKEFLRSWPTK